MGCGDELMIQVPVDQLLFVGDRLMSTRSLYVLWTSLSRVICHLHGAVDVYVGRRFREVLPLLFGCNKPHVWFIYQRYPTAVYQFHRSKKMYQVTLLVLPCISQRFFHTMMFMCFPFLTDGRFGIRMANLRVPNFMVEWPAPISYPMFGCISHITCPFHIFPIWVCLKMWYTPQTGCFNGEPDAIQLELAAWFHIMHIFSYVLHIFPIPSGYQT